MLSSVGIVCAHSVGCDAVHESASVLIGDRNVVIDGK